MRRILCAALVMPSLVATVSAQSSPAAQAARQWRQQRERAIVEEFMALLAIPNVSRDTVNIQRNAEAIRDALIRRGVAARLVSVQGANPVVFGDNVNVEPRSRDNLLSKRGASVGDGDRTTDQQRR